MKKAKYKRILLKLSGEALVGNQGYGIDPEIVKNTAAEVKEIYKLGVQIGIVIGGGNIFRGLSAHAKNMDRVQADQMGMLATIINSIAIQNALELEGIETVIQSSIPMDSIAEPIVIRRAMRHFEKGRIVIFGGGTGNPYFTTDTAAVLRAREINAEIIIKATKVDGVYDSDPVKNPKAKKIDKISYIDVLNKNLRVLDTTAISFSMENKLRIGVVNLLKSGHLKRFVMGEKIGSIVE
ncbi:TPA: UMP kinase [Candidatus Delongbacteria bacterium]|nr:MAG: UMP kinase [Candidatus Delongbacteria bacterium GWF2_40_14]HAQ62097.1 UMP kinase [Candidatus Delongbacteria bacterium]